MKLTSNFLFRVCCVNLQLSRRYMEIGILLQITKLLHPLQIDIMNDQLLLIAASAQRNRLTQN